MQERERHEPSYVQNSLEDLCHVCSPPNFSSAYSFFLCEPFMGVSVFLNVFMEFE